MNAQGNPAKYKPHSNPRICESKKSVNLRSRCSLHLYHHSKYIVQGQVPNVPNESLAVDFHLLLSSGYMYVWKVWKVCEGR